MDNIRHWRRWCNLTPSPFVYKYDLLRLTAIQRQIICPRPRLDVLNLDSSRVDVDDWHSQVGVVGKFAKFIASSHHLQVACSHHIRRWSNGRVLDDAGCDGFQRRRLTTVYSAVGVLCEEVGQPVVDLVWKVERGQFLHQSNVPDCVKSLAKV
jgi:hypothetical protein